MFKKFKNNCGATAIEYGLIAAGIAVAILGGTYVAGHNTEATFCSISQAIGAASTSCSKVYYNGKEIPYGVNMGYVSQTQGGTGSANANQWHSEIDHLVGDVLSNINSKDPIVGIYGLYDGSGKVVSSLSEYNINNGAETQNDLGNDSYNTLFQVATQSGQVYNISGDYVNSNESNSASEFGGNTDQFKVQVTNSSTGAVDETAYKNGSFAVDGNTHDTGFTQ